MKKTLFLFLIFIFLAGGIYLHRFNNNPDQKILPASNTNSANLSIEAEKNIDLPATLSIPSIGVTAVIEYVGLDEKRNMDVPKRPKNVAWYNLGPKPGQMGSAVIAGHLDDPSGVPAVFWDIKSLELGSEIRITDKNGETLKFIVKAVENYPWNNFPLHEVFADTTEKKLNLITCGGTFDKDSKNYSERTVVFANLKE